MAVTVAKAPVEQLEGQVRASYAVARVLARLQLAGTPNRTYSRLFAALGLPVRVPAFDRRWDYSGYLRPTLESAARAALRKVDGNRRIPVGNSAALRQFLPELSRELRAAENAAENTATTTQRQ
jgi:hypothetical protein